MSCAKKYDQTSVALTAFTGCPPDAAAGERPAAGKRPSAAERAKAAREKKENEAFTQKIVEQDRITQAEYGAVVQAYQKHSPHPLQADQWPQTIADRKQALEKGLKAIPGIAPERVRQLVDEVEAKSYEIAHADVDDPEEHLRGKLRNGTSMWPREQGRIVKWVRSGEPGNRPEGVADFELDEAKPFIDDYRTHRARLGELEKDPAYQHGREQLGRNPHNDGLKAALQDYRAAAIGDNTDFRQEKEIKLLAEISASEKTAT